MCTSIYVQADYTTTCYKCAMDGASDTTVTMSLVSTSTYTSARDDSYCWRLIEREIYRSSCGHLTEMPETVLESQSHTFHRAASVNTPDYCSEIYDVCTYCDYNKFVTRYSHSFRTVTVSSSTGCNGQATQQVCSNCGWTKSKVDKSHSWSSWSSWSNGGSSGCYRTRTCRTCGRSETDYASHSFRYGSWSPSGSSEHSRSATCTTCGYSTTFYGSHTRFGS